MLLQVLALVGDQLDFGDNICGAVLSIRFNEDILSVWNRNASDHQVHNPIFYCHSPHISSIQDHNFLIYCMVITCQAVMGLRDSIKRHLKLPHGYVMEYKPHDASLRDNSSYRNTWLRGWEKGECTWKLNGVYMVCTSLIAFDPSLDVKQLIHSDNSFFRILELFLITMFVLRWIGYYVM